MRLLITAWVHLPAVVRADIVAMVKRHPLHMRRFVTHLGYQLAGLVYLTIVRTTCHVTFIQWGAIMTSQELKQNLSDPAKFEKFKTHLGGVGQGRTVQWYLAEFNRAPHLYEGIWAAYFKLPTEEARKTRATLEAGAAAKDSARHAKEANPITVEASRIAASANTKAGWALLVSIIVALVSLAGLVVACIK